MSWQKWNGDKILNILESDLSEANMDAMQAVGEISDQQVPHDEGTLQASKVVMKDPNNPLKVYLAYGGGGVSGFVEVPYARRWHEVPANFGKGRKHNYLRDPMKSDSARILRNAVERRQKQAL